MVEISAIGVNARGGTRQTETESASKSGWHLGISLGNRVKYTPAISAGLGTGIFTLLGATLWDLDTPIPFKYAFLIASSSSLFVGGAVFFYQNYSACSNGYQEIKNPATPGGSEFSFALDQP
ncbi:hypothetical protein QS306_15750 [Paraburkholderia bonniea]|uniref:hypothetical protein n=1 Tax=Paraburkholderia bonniea TaxID=2152891 RepID=UPI001291A76E|nr:hypothetical protein [Paraburkholderia bonniea]WJF91543.1 hypothetical protein QS306_15750 [Paraburkholderia bonniea]WJF94862.1 hypothetical protein QS308_15755 [Paraburkholderia bonniea]